MRYSALRYTPLLLLLLCSAHVGQAQSTDEGSTSSDSETLYPDAITAAWLATLGSGWGYNYDSLLADLPRWQQSPRVTARTIGRSVQGRDIWEVAITSPAPLVTLRRTVTIHARTHPGEVQGTRVVNAMIAHLISDLPEFTRLVDSVAFVIVPMINPDGVEIGAPRENANGIDLERNWDKSPMEPEVASLKTLYSGLMQSPAPVEVALNLHSDYRCKRFFVYHVTEATSPVYSKKEQDFITSVCAYYPTGIEAWNYNQTWQTGAPTHFPESWFWYTYGDAVLALTYEDMNCPAAGAFDTTAYAILHGIADYLQIDIRAAVEAGDAERRVLLRSARPNPFRTSTTLQYVLPRESHVTLRVFSPAGAELARLTDEKASPGMHELVWNADGLPSGAYYCTMQAGSTFNTISLLKID